MTGGAAAESGRRFLPAGAWITAAAFLLPLKFGGLAAMPDAAANYPAAWWEYLIVSWPASFFAVAGAVALLLVLAACAGKEGIRFAAPVAPVALLWGFGLVLAALPGRLNTPNPEAAFVHTLHFAGCGCFILAVALLLRADAAWSGRLTAALAAGTLLLGVSALRQYFFGFAETRRFIADAVAAGAAPPGESLRLYLADDRVYATFSSCNTLAGFLLLVLPCVVLVVRDWGDRFEPRRIARPLFAGIALALTLVPFLLTRSRGAFLAALLTAGIWFFTRPGIARRRKFFAAAALLILIAAAAWHVGRYGRGFGSMAERADYLRTAAVLTAEHPVAGGGWESFHLLHMKIKSSPSNEAARDPHNPVAAFASQCGIPAGILAAAVLLVPPILFLKRRAAPGMPRAALWGYVAFALHSCMEIDFLVPANLAAAGILLLAALPSEPGKPSCRVSAAVGFFALSALFAAATLAAALRWIPGELAFARFSDAVRPLPGAVPTDPLAAERKALALRGGSRAVWELVGERRFAGGDPLGARSAFLAARERGGDRAALEWKLAGCAEAVGDRAAAEEHRRRARELFPTNPIYRRNSALEEGGVGTPPPPPLSSGVRASTRI